MVLVDTSVWIRFLAGRAPFAVGLEKLLGDDEVTGHDLVYGELLVGDQGGRSKLLEAYEQIPHVGMVTHDEVVAFARDRNLGGRGAGWIDIHLLAAAIVGRVQLWTADKRLCAIAEQLGIGYEPLSGKPFWLT